MLGLLLYGLIPLLGAIHHDGSFWELLRQKLSEQKIYLTHLPRYYAFVAGTATLVRSSLPPSTGRPSRAN